MTPTIKDVAAHAGFSIATVSRAINAPHTVNPITLDKVRQSIDALNFRPSPLGRQLRGERTRLIGVIVPTLANLCSRSVCKASTNSRRRKATGSC